MHLTESLSVGLFLALTFLASLLHFFRSRSLGKVSIESNIEVWFFVSFVCSSLFDSKAFSVIYCYLS